MTTESATGLPFVECVDEGSLDTFGCGAVGRSSQGSGSSSVSRHDSERSDQSLCLVDVRRSRSRFSVVEPINGRAVPSRHDMPVDVDRDVHALVTGLLLNVGR